MHWEASEKRMCGEWEGNLMYIEVQKKSWFNTLEHHDEIPYTESLQLARIRLAVGAKQYVYVCVVLSLSKLTSLKACVLVQSYSLTNLTTAFPIQNSTSA